MIYCHSLRSNAHQSRVSSGVVHYRGQHDRALLICQYGRSTTAHRSHQGIGRAKVYTYRTPHLVRHGRLARLGYL